MGIPQLIGWLLPGGRAELLPGPPPISPEDEARRASDRELESMLRDLLRERLAAGEATIIANDPDAAERLATEMGVSIPPEALSAARLALAERRRVLTAEVAGVPPQGYPLAGSYNPERFRSLGHEAAAVLQRFARYGENFEDEYRDGQRLLAIAEELSYGGAVREWSPGRRGPRASRTRHTPGRSSPGSRATCSTSAAT